MSASFFPTVFNAASVEEAHDIGERVFYSHRLEPSDVNAEFGMHLTAGRLGAATIGSTSYSTEVVINCVDTDDSYSMCIPVTGGMEVQTSAHEVLASPSNAVITGPVRDIRLRGWSEASDPMILVKFERASLEAELSRMIGRDLPGPVKFVPTLDLTVGDGRRWSQIVSLVASELTSPQSLFWNPLMAERLSTTLLAGLCIAADHQYRDVLDARGNPTTPATIRRAVAFIDDHLHEPITTISVAAAVGLSVRTLERGFSRFLSTSPRRYIERARLGMAHAELKTASPEMTTVTQIATRWGFGHHGRFAAIYRSCYGVFPSETLRENTY